MALVFPALCILLSAWQACAVIEMEKVSVGETAAINCLFVNMEPSSVVVQWFVRGKTGRMERIYYINSSLSAAELGTDFTDRISVSHENNRAILNIEKVKLTDEGDFICRVNDVSSASEEKKTHLKVFASPEPPMVEAIDVGISVNIQTPSKVATCETRNGYPEPIITWYRNLTTLQNSDDVKIMNRLTLESSGLYTVQSELYVRVSKEDKDVFFYCEVSFAVPGGMKMIESKPLKIIVYYPTTSVEIWKEYPKGLVKEGDTVKIRCRGNGNPQPLLTIKKDNDKSIYKEDGLLVLENVSRENSGSYVCQSLDLETDYETEGTISLEVNYLDNAVVDPKESEVSLGQNIEVSCNANSSLDTYVQWFKDGMNVSDDQQLYLQDATYDMAGEYTCEVTVPSLSDLKSSAVFSFLVYGPPKIMDLKHDELKAVGTSVNLTCEAQGLPLPTITWNITGIWTQEEVVDEMSVRSLINIRVTSDLIASCNATSDSGTDVRSFTIKAVPLISTFTVPSNNGTTAMKVQKENGVIIAVIIICILLLAILGSVLYFLYKKGKLACGRSAKKDITNDKGNKDGIVMEMKTDKTEETVLLQGVNGDKKSNDQ